MLRRSERTVAELAAEVAVSENAVRVHLGGLDQGWSDPRDVGDPGDRGKPAQVYALTDGGRELFARAYPGFLASIIGVLESREGAVKARRLLREAGRRASPSPAEATGDLASRVEAAAAALRELGGDVEIVRTPDGFRLRGHGCPLGAVVTVEPVACALAKAFVSAMVGAPVTERCDRGAVPRCAFDLKLPPSRS